MDPLTFAVAGIRIDSAVCFGRYLDKHSARCDRNHLRTIR